jgi:hypothetical protein
MEKKISTLYPLSLVFAANAFGSLVLKPEVFETFGAARCRSQIAVFLVPRGAIVLVDLTGVAVIDVAGFALPVASFVKAGLTSLAEVRRFAVQTIIWTT